jgi:diaminopimelate epimerase
MADMPAGLAGAHAGVRIGLTQRELGNILGMTRACATGNAAASCASTATKSSSSSAMRWKTWRKRQQTQTG